MLAALSQDNQPALQSTLIVARRSLRPDDYRDLIRTAFDAHRCGSLDADAQRQQQQGAGQQAALSHVSVRCWCQLAAALQELNRGSPRAVLQVHVDMLRELARDWQVEGQEVVRAQKDEVIQLAKVLMLEQEATGTGCVMIYMETVSDIHEGWCCRGGEGYVRGHAYVITGTCGQNGAKQGGLVLMLVRLWV